MIFYLFHVLLKERRGRIHRCGDYCNHKLSKEKQDRTKQATSINIEVKVQRKTNKQKIKLKKGYILLKDQKLDWHGTL